MRNERSLIIGPASGPGLVRLVQMRGGWSKHELCKFDMNANRIDEKCAKLGKWAPGWWD